METVYIAGVGMTPFTRQPDTTVKALTESAVSDALRDAGSDAKDIQAAFFGNCAQGLLEQQHLIRGQVALLPIGFTGIPIINVENACATASTALHLGVQYLRAGVCDIVLAVGAERMYVSDKAKRLAIFDSAWDVAESRETLSGIQVLGRGITPPAGSIATAPYSPFMDVYASFAKQYMRLYGVTQRQLAAIASKNRKHAAHNERAQFRDPMSIDEVLAAPPITYPLTLPMCCPVSDGAAAAVLCTQAGLERLRGDKRRAVVVHASVLRTASVREGDDLQHHLTRIAAQQAYDQAGLGPEDMNVCEVHDATAMAELIQSENLGFCAPGEGGLLAESGATTLGGRIPINPSGGLESKGHPIGATGLGQVFELVSQLRGDCGARQVDGARFAIQENGGGIWGVEESVAHIGIFGRAS